MNCERCGNQHDGLFASGRFCSRFCANSFSRGNLSAEIKTEIGNNVGAKLSKYTVEDRHAACAWCGSPFVKKQMKTICCSRSCGSKFVQANLSAQQKIDAASRARDRMLRRIADGDRSIGWQTRDSVKGSYPEQFFEQLLKQDNISFQREIKIEKWFADFLIGRHVLEIDGRQHDDRKIKDAEKDAALREAGFIVTRIRWRNIKSKSGLQQLLSDYNAFKTTLER